MEQIVYFRDRTISPDQFIDVLKRSTLSERRPVNEPARIQKMLDYGNILITAWAGELLVGVSRAISDFAFCCYLSDLAVDETYQKKGIGKKLIEETHLVAGKHTTLILLAAPAAVDYYPKVGMDRMTDCFVIRRSS
ncbi:MAG TPA: GNAT family N-acetyltransferase [Cyclobacteriaceae bacterium]|nr:GNAT family N-acetyltransferase [Cyclobacteriaceae bacterium]